MSFHESFSRYIYWPLVQRLKGEHAACALKELSESQWKTRDELIDMQWQRVRAAVNKAIREVPYYRKSCVKTGWDDRNENYRFWSRICKNRKADRIIDL